MAEVSNQRVIDRYRELLSLRTHDVIVRDAAIEQLEAEIKKLQDANLKLFEEVRDLKGDTPTHNVVPGEVVDLGE